MAAPSRLQLHLVRTVLQYISPTSQLALPPHLISSQLKQRHHYLSISPDDPSAFLCWPSANQERAIDLLDSLQLSLDHQPVEYPILYTTDPESTYAHVQVTPDDVAGLRVVFTWDQSEGWKYHNAALMPFPPGCFSFSALNQAVPKTQQDPRMSIPHDDDSYWESYGRDDDEDDPHVHIVDISKDKAQAGTEDAYWAQYAAIQGSGDSTLPSPVSEKRKHAIDLEPITFTYSDLHPSSAPNPSGPLSPDDLSERLTVLSGRSQQFQDDDFFGSDSDTPSPSVNGGLKLEGDRDPASAANEFPSPPDEDGIDEVTGREALKDSIRGIYRLWSLGRPTTSHDMDLFLSIVGEAINNQ